MAAGDSTLVAAQTKAQYITPSSSLVGQAFDAVLQVSMSNSNILSQLEGAPGTGKPFAVVRDLEKGAMDKINMNVAAALGQAGRRGTQRAVNFEEPLFHNSWSVQIDSLRTVVGWNDIVKQVATTGKSWQVLYPQLVGELQGRIMQEDALLRLRQRTNSKNTVRAGNATSLDTIRYNDTVDTEALSYSFGLLTRNGAKPAMIGKTTGGLPLSRYVILGPSDALDGLWLDPIFSSAITHAAIEGPSNPFWTGDLPNWKGSVIKRWEIIASSDTPGAASSSLMPEATLGDAITQATTAVTIYGGGRTQASLGDAATLYKPFEYFYGVDKLFGLTISSGTDTNVYYFIIVDPADGKWNMYSYTGSAAFAANGYSVTTTQRLAASASGTAVTTLGGVTWNGTVNKEAFPTGSTIIQVNALGVPVCDTYLFGMEVGAKCYGTKKNEPIQNVDDYGALQGKGVWSFYGQDVAVDSTGQYHRRHVRLQSAYRHPLGVNFPQIAP